MTKDTYIALVKKTLQSEPAIKIHESHTTKLAALGRQVERKERDPEETIPEIEKIFFPFVDTKLRKDLEKAFR